MKLRILKNPQKPSRFEKRRFSKVFRVFRGFLKVFEGHEATKSGSEGCWSDSLTINRHFIDIIDRYQAQKYRFSKVFKGF